MLVVPSLAQPELTRQDLPMELGYLLSPSASSTSSAKPSKRCSVIRNLFSSCRTFNKASAAIRPSKPPVSKLQPYESAASRQLPTPPPSSSGDLYAPPKFPIASLPPPTHELTVSARHLLYHRLDPEFSARYTLGEELGSGGFGFVVSAVRNCDGAEVAVKFIFRNKVPAHSWAADPVYGLIPMEAFVLRQARHKNIVGFLDLFQDECYFYLVMELHGTPWTSEKQPQPHADEEDEEDILAAATHDAALRPTGLLVRRTSCDLFECIEHHRKFSEDQARHIFRQVVDAVHHLSRLGVCHRDIKDENIVIDDHYRVKLIDFGSAVIIPPHGAWFDRFYGTVNYAAPEILMGHRYRAEHAEIWALGVLLYTILYGEVPFSDPLQAIHEPFTQPRLKSSPECDALLRWMLAKQPDHRPSIDTVRRHPWLNAL
ncbi:uncharacterized protein VTP21DRAFT_2307 [Calcarisporiella thermophila]|uniref:uncharacterized protein n=1 Tax=Calcarisporiella thermophila TaxID=911321 RepID=UPI00374356C8